MTENTGNTNNPDDMSDRTGRHDRNGRDAGSERAAGRGTDRTGSTGDTGGTGGTAGAAGSGAPRSGGGDPLGSAAEEALKLFDALQRKAARELRKNLVKGTMTGFGSAFSGGGGRGGRDVWEEAVSDHDEEYICRACPVCRAMAAQRESGGQVTDHLVQAGSELFAAFKSAVDALNRPSAAQRAREREASREDTPVEHIDLG
ncbi:DUF5304 family protein [Planomonospora parontospora]|uniref:DUF5304 family protein n=1 Tax=Planomonospora parontospora TaxID=58119 RepID=UPI00167125F5|nr:DUF5304 family protein [Planomonospora parontospora]GGL04416.1 hypothetical protein GCM10014719_03280 [Planomonospora parontospora subsp. antibiotica]GII13487.1 hypothetical protein Ppa05_02130 [Planomonospora parontospora subsp. antibiotica]